MGEDEETISKNKLTNGDTNKIYISFEIDVPKTNYESNFNTLVLDIFRIKEYDYYAMKSEIDLKVKNEILSEIQKIAELLKYKEI